MGVTLGDISVRALHENDRISVAHIIRESREESPHAYASNFEESIPDIVAACAKGDPSTAFGAFQGNQIIGIIGITRDTRSSTRHRCTLHSLYVTKSLRRLRIGQKLLRAAIEAAKAMGCKQIHAWATAGSSASSALLIEGGFVSEYIAKDDLFINGHFIDTELFVLRF